jgi:hypothetical protein
VCHVTGRLNIWLEGVLCREPVTKACVRSVWLDGPPPAWITWTNHSGHSRWLDAPPGWHLGYKDHISQSPWVQSFFFSFFFFCGRGAWTQGLHFEPLHQPLFCDGCFPDRVSQAICLGWLWTAILLLSASWVARITGVSHQCPKVGRWSGEQKVFGPRLWTVATLWEFWKTIIEISEIMQVSVLAPWKSLMSSNRMYQPREMTARTMWPILVQTRIVDFGWATLALAGSPCPASPVFLGIKTSSCPAPTSSSHQILSLWGKEEILKPQCPAKECKQKGAVKKFF